MPDAGKPDSFTGAVGVFNISTDIDKTELKANEALNYKIKITGAGNIKLLKRKVHLAATGKQPKERAPKGKGKAKAKAKSAE